MPEIKVIDPVGSKSTRGRHERVNIISLSKVIKFHMKVMYRVSTKIVYSVNMVLLRHFLYNHSCILY